MKALQIETVEQYVQILDRQPEEADRLLPRELSSSAREDSRTTRIS
jgi:hypothetical protein